MDLFRRRSSCVSSRIPFDGIDLMAAVICVAVRTCDIFGMMSMLEVEVSAMNVQGGTCIVR